MDSHNCKMRRVWTVLFAWWDSNKIKYESGHATLEKLGSVRLIQSHILLHIAKYCLKSQILTLGSLGVTKVVKISTKRPTNLISKHIFSGYENFYCFIWTETPEAEKFPKKIYCLVKFL